MAENALIRPAQKPIIRVLEQLFHQLHIRNAKAKTMAQIKGEQTAVLIDPFAETVLWTLGIDGDRAQDGKGRRTRWNSSQKSVQHTTKIRPGNGKNEREESGCQA